MYVCMYNRYSDSVVVQSCLVMIVSLLMRHRRFDEELETYRAFLICPPLTRLIKRYRHLSMYVCMYVCIDFSFYAESMNECMYVCICILINLVVLNHMYVCMFV